MVTQEAAPTKAESEPPHVSDCPFVELSFFTEQTAAFFFGRDAERRTIMNNLRASRLTLLHAVSGTGKSSLLRAGVAHRLRELAKQNYRQRGTAGYLPVVCSSWTETPVVELVHQIETSIGTFFSEEDRPVLPQRLDLAITAASQLVDAKLLIMLDQFEEYSLYRPGDPSQGLLLEQLSYAINQPEIRANFLISIREDAYASLGDLFRGRVPNLYGNYLGLSKLSRKKTRRKRSSSRSSAITSYTSSSNRSPSNRHWWRRSSIRSVWAESHARTPALARSMAATGPTRSRLRSCSWS